MSESTVGRRHVASTSPNERLLSDHEWNVIREFLRLSEREGQIVQGIVADESEKAIARRLGISRHTVHTHVERLYRKLSIASRGQLFGMVMRAYIDFFADRNG